MSKVNAESTRCRETLKSRIERELEAHQWDSYLRTQSDDRYYTNGGYRADALREAELKRKLQEAA